MDTWDNHAASAYAGGAGISSNPYKIQTAQQLALLSKQSKTNSFSGVYFSLEQPVDMSQYLWTGIGFGGIQFAGNFNGGYNSIFGIKIYNNNGFFNAVKNATIEKVILKDEIIYWSTDVNGVAGLCGATNNSTISNCIVDNLDLYVTNRDDFICGLVGYTALSTVTNCIVMNSTLENASCILAQDEEDFPSRINNSSAINVVGKNNDYFSLHNCSNITSSFGEFYIFGSNKKALSKSIYGSNSDFGDWMYSSTLNRGYPVQKSFLTISSSSTQTSAQVYSHLVSKGFSAA